VLTVTDDDGATGTASVPITAAANQPPVAVANGTPNSGKSPLTVAFSSAGSVDNDGTIVGYSWDFGDGSPLNTTANPSYTYSTPGTYTAVLTVTDDSGATGTNSVVVTVGPANVNPIAAPSSDVTSGKAPLTVYFSSSGSSDPDGTIAGYSWDFGDGSPVSTDPNPAHTYTAPGNYTALLTVTDNDGGTNTQPLAITVNANQAPTAVAGADDINDTAPFTTNFSSAGSIDPDGTIVSYSWDFGDGSPVDTTANPSHTYPVAGSYTATLTVTDDNGATGTSTVAITAN
jgi:PKD repeat protein